MRFEYDIMPTLSDILIYSLPSDMFIKFEEEFLLMFDS